MNPAPAIGACAVLSILPRVNRRPFSAAFPGGDPIKQPKNERKGAVVVGGNEKVVQDAKACPGPLDIAPGIECMRKGIWQGLDDLAK
jgi:hypothetical protein